MKKWRPVAQVQVKVIGVCISAGRLLAMDVYADGGKLKGVRPLGGHVEFGETREAALAREFQEELGTGIVLDSEWYVFENIYMHHGEVGHEYIFAADITLLDETLLEQDVIAFSEDSGTENIARWHELDILHSRELDLYPAGLIDML